MFHQDWVITSVTAEFSYKVKKMSLNPFRLRKKLNPGLLFEGPYANFQYFVTTSYSLYKCPDEVYNEQ